MVHNTAKLGRDVVVAKVGVSFAILRLLTPTHIPCTLIARAHDDDLETNPDSR